jgi:hypothetical protein
MPEEAPLYFPEDLDVDMSLQEPPEPELIHFESVSLYRLVESISSFFDILSRFTPIEGSSSGHVFFSSQIWQLFESSLCGLSESVLRSLLRRLPLQYFSRLEQFSDEHQRLIRNESYRRESISHFEYDQIFKEARKRLARILEDSYTGADSRVFKSILEVYDTDDYDEKSIALLGILTKIFSKSDNPNRSWIADLDSKLTNHHFLRFMIWSHFSYEGGWDDTGIHIKKDHTYQKEMRKSHL